MTTLVFVLIVLASFRAWRLIGRDDITSFARRPMPELALKGVTCPWCLGLWVTIGVGAAVHAFVYDLVRGVVLNRIGFVALVVAAASALVGFIGELDGKLQ